MPAAKKTAKTSNSTAVTEPTVLIFDYERDTQNKKRFQEMNPLGEGQKSAVPAPKKEAVIEKLYVSKEWLAARGDPDTLRVRIEIP